MEIDRTRVQAASVEINDQNADRFVEIPWFLAASEETSLQLSEMLLLPL